MAKLLYRRNWDFTLFEVNNKQVITVVFFGLVDTEKSFYLVKEVKKNEYESLKELSEEIRNNYETFKGFEIEPAIVK